MFFKMKVGYLTKIEIVELINDGARISALSDGYLIELKRCNYSIFYQRENDKRWFELWCGVNGNYHEHLFFDKEIEWFEFHTSKRGATK